MLRDGRVTGSAKVAEDRSGLAGRENDRAQFRGSRTAREENPAAGSLNPEPVGSGRGVGYQPDGERGRDCRPGRSGGGGTHGARALGHRTSRPVSGTIEVFGRTVRIRSPNAAARLGIAYVTEDRKAQGLLPNRSVRENATIANLRRFARWGILRLATEARYARDMVKRLDVRLASPGVEIRTLSGGNQQKVLIGRALAIEPRILLLDEPTRGVDIGAKQEIYAAIERLVAEGWRSC